MASRRSDSASVKLNLFKIDSDLEFSFWGAFYGGTFTSGTTVWSADYFDSSFCFFMKLHLNRICTFLLPHFLHSVVRVWYGVDALAGVSGAGTESYLTTELGCWSYLMVPFYNNFETPSVGWDSFSLNRFVGRSVPIPLRSPSIELDAADFLLTDLSSEESRLRFLGKIFFFTTLATFLAWYPASLSSDSLFWNFFAGAFMRSYLTFFSGVTIFGFLTDSLAL